MKLFLDACSIIYLIESQQEQGRKTRLMVDIALKDRRLGRATRNPANALK